MSLACILFTVAGFQSDRPPDFAADVMPVLTKYCLSCHSEDDAQSGLRLDTHALIFTGGKKGPAAVAGDPEKSRLLAMTEGRLKPKMPPKDNPAPSPAEVDVLRRWIAGGAKPASGAAARPASPARAKLKPKALPASPVHALAASPKGDLLAIGGRGVVRLVDAKAGTIVRELKGPDGAVTAAAFSADGSRLAAAGGQPGRHGSAVVWSVKDGRVLASIKGHRDSLHAVAISPDGMLLATAGYDRDILLWKVTDGSLPVVRALRDRTSGHGVTGPQDPAGTLTGHNDAVYGLAFRSDGKVLASVSGDRTVKLWDVARAERLDTLGESLKELHAVAFSVDGARLYSAGVDNRIRVYSIGPAAKEGTNRLVGSHYAHNATILKLAVSPGGDMLVSAAADDRVKFWSVEPLREIRLLDPQPAPPVSLAFIDNAGVVVGRLDGTLAVFDRGTGAKKSDLKPTPPMPVKPEVAAMSPRGVRAGTKARVTLAGKGLKDAAISSSHPKVTATLGDGSTSERLEVEVSAAADAPRGDIELSIKTAAGMTSRKLWIDDIPQLTEADAVDKSGAAAVPVLPASFWGVIEKPGETDVVRIKAKKGQTLVAELAAAAIGSKLVPTLTVVDGAGRPVGTIEVDSPKDPVAIIRAEADGEFLLRVTDAEAGGSAEHAWRLSVGEFAWANGVWPVAVPADSTTPVTPLGWNIPAGASVLVKAEGPGRATVPLDPLRFRYRSLSTVAVIPSLARESEPNDAAAGATPLALPGAVVGRLHLSEETSPRDVDLYRLKGKKGEPIIIETEAARLGLPIDTRVDVLTADGRPTERLWMQAVRDSVIEFRSINSTQLEIRCLNWEEMDLNQFLYLRGEVSRLFRMPQGPDSGFLFYAQSGRRRTYFDTTATAHALADPVYIVEPHPPGTPLIPNGLPVFRLPWSNDDASDGTLGRDSRLTFTPAADGDYLIRVSDTRGRVGERVGYVLKVRPPEPDFSVALVGVNPTVNRGSGRALTFVATRVDGFDEEIHIDVAGLPPGFSVSTPISIEAGHLEARAVLHCGKDVPEPTKENWSAARFTARATIDGESVSRGVMLSGKAAPVDPRSSRLREAAKKAKPVNDLGRITLGAPPKIRVRMEPAEVSIEPGGEATVDLIVERAGFNDRISFTVDNLPHGVIVDNIGLNGILLPAGQTRRQMTLAARKHVPPQSRPFFAVATVDGDQASPPVMLHVKPREKRLATGGR